MGAGILCGLMLVLAGPHASAAQAAKEPSQAALEKLLTPDAGNKACYARRYDAAHLRAHPRQRIESVLLVLRATGLDASGDIVTKSPERIQYQFAMRIKRRGEKRTLSTAGDCFGETAAECVVDCDGGGVRLESAPEGLLVHLLENGVLMFSDCDGGGVWVRPGADDKAFALTRAVADACAALERQHLSSD
jgi:hypothetical protein